MSFENIHAYQTGLLFKKEERWIFIVTVLFEKKPAAQLDRIFSETINNQQIHIVLRALFSRYTLIFFKEDKRPAMKMNFYLVGKTPQELVGKTKRAISKLKVFFEVLGFELFVLDARKELERIKKTKKPKTFLLMQPGLFRIQTSKGQKFLSVIKITFNTLEERRDLIVLLQDFYSVFETGKIILDVYANVAPEDNAKNALSIAILVILEDENEERVRKERKKLLSLLSMLQLPPLENGQQKFRLILESELKKNFNNILFNQAWDFHTVAIPDWLDFIEFLRLL